MKLQEKMFALVQAWHKSGLTRQKFISGKAVGIAKFDYWICKYRKSQCSLKQSLPATHSPEVFKSFAFSEEPREADARSISMEIVTPSGVRITIYQ